MGMKKKATEDITALASANAIPTTAVEQTPATQTVAEIKPVKHVEPAAEAFGRKLTPYELLKDRRIAAAGVVQSLAPIYHDQAMGLKPEDADNYVEEKARLMLDLIQRIAEGK